MQYNRNTTLADFNLNNNYAMNLGIGNPLLQNEDLKQYSNPQSL
jgi:hypothetical protein